MKSSLLLIVLLALPGTQTTDKRVDPVPSVVDGKPPYRSAHLAFVDREYIFTLEIVKPGVPLLNFVSMSDTDNRLMAKDVRLEMGNRSVSAKYFVVDTGNPKEPVIVSSLRMRSRSSFGFRIQGEFEDVRELPGATIRLGSEDFSLVPLTSFAFENLALKVNRINLGSPDFRDDWRVLKMEALGSRAPSRR